MRQQAAGLVALAAAAVFVHGYHLGVDDAEIYVPGIKRAADPGLFPFGSEFFMHHAHLSLFPDLVGGSSRFFHLPVDWAIFLWHCIGILLILAAAWKVAGACFKTRAARWGSVAMVAAGFSIPVAGTALVIMDPYVTSRSLSTPATLFAVACLVGGQPRRAIAWLLFTALIHPQMAVYGAVLLGCIEVAGRFQWVRKPEAVLAAALPFLWPLGPAHGVARQVLLSRTFFFLWSWQWYEWLGVVAPLALLAWLAARPPARTTPVFRRLAAVLVPFGLAFTVAGIVLSATPLFENYTRLQPMRAFHIVYVILFVLLGGLAGEYLLRNKSWRWLALFVPVAAGMWFLQHSAYPYSPHVELPGARARNNWVDAFLWIRGHTPRNAVFALDPNYMAIPEDDQHGFRAVAERSVLADAVKDSGAVSLFPQLADEWAAEVAAQSGWARFQFADFQRLARQYPVTWVVTNRPPPAGLECPYENAELSVCRVSSPR